MKHENINYVAVGGFVTVIVAVFVVTISLIAGKAGATDEYYVVYERVNGLKYGNVVSFEGYPVGNIGSITPLHQDNGTRYKVTLNINKGWPIPDDSNAQMISSGLLAEVAVDIQEGTSATLLKPGQVMRGSSSTDVFTAVNDMAAELGQVIADLHTITDVAADKSGVPLLLSRVNTLAGNMNTTVNEIDKLVGNANKIVNKDLEQGFAGLGTSLQVVTENIDSIAQNLDIASRNLSEFSRQIRNNPGLLLNGTPQKDQTASPGAR